MCFGQAPVEGAARAAGASQTATAEEMAYLQGAGFRVQSFGLGV